MNWKSVSQQLPEETGNYLASIGIPRHGGLYVFTDLIYFNSESRKWYKYDPFDLNYKPNDDITHQVKGWVVDAVTYLG